MEMMVQNAIKEANEAKLEAAKAQEELHVSKTFNDDLNERLEGMKKAKEVLVETHDKVINQLTKRHQGIEEDLKLERKEAKVEFRRTIEEMEQQHAESIRELAEEKSRLRQKIDDVRQEAKTIQMNQNVEKTRLLDKHKEDLKQLQNENEASRETFEAQIASLKEEISNIEKLAKITKKERDDVELELQKSRVIVKNLNKNLEENVGEKEHIRELIRVDLEKEISEGKQCKEKLESVQKKCVELESELQNIKDAYDKERQELTTKIAKLESELEQIKYERFLLTLTIK